MAELYSKKFKSVEEYFSYLSPQVRNILEKLRQTIKQAAPEAEEVISYNMPAYKYFGILVYFMAHKNHIGFYPGNKAVNEVFKDELKDYKTSSGTIQLPMNENIPKRLIKRIVKFRIEENLKKGKVKRNAETKRKRSV